MSARGLARSCSWCSHPPHAGACPRQIVTATVNKKPQLKPCPCARRKDTP